MRGLKTRLRGAKKKRAARKKKKGATRRAPRTRAAAAKVGALLTFRAEVMPGREREERTFTVARVLASGRVELKGLTGQHALAEFEPVQ